MKKNNTNSLALKMSISLGLGLLLGGIFIFLREYLLSNDQGTLWTSINNTLFQDISKPEGKNALGLFYIIGQLFINSLQLVIVPMVFTSIALAMCKITDTKKLGRISSKTLLG
ncbi:MAG: cation:dicarboxylate symporter family transporter, partial [Clostridium sp.]|uniref:cation:dicarboxylate symporter family transporter n=1 Tax=Clostridium sp. TaxID=1506 RepID=UPI003F2FB4D0